MHAPSPFRSDERGLLGPYGPLGPAFTDDLMRMMVSTFHRESTGDPSDNDLCKWSAALTTLEAFRPRDPVEAILAAQSIATHHQVMECLARCMRPGLAEATCSLLRRDAVILMRGMDIGMRAIERRQAKPLPPPLPEVPAAVDAVLDLELERAKQRAAEAAARKPEPGEATRPAFVIPKLAPNEPVNPEILAALVNTAREEINRQLDIMHGGTPEEWYARDRQVAQMRAELATWHRLYPEGPPSDPEA